MRIAAGRFKGRQIAAPAGDGTRPTADRARQALFNMLEHAPWSRGLAGARALDLFAGSGALGLEALSRGAAGALFVENARPALAALEANLRACGLDPRGLVLRADAAALPPRAGAAFDLVFADPPYRQGLAARALARAAAGGWIAPSALVVAETAADEAAPALDGARLLDERRYGAARLWMFAWGGAADGPVSSGGATPG